LGFNAVHLPARVANAGELTMLTLSALSKNFGGLRVLEEVNLNVPERGIFGLIGPNGAGKTTVFNLVTGLLTPSAGSIEFAGRRLNGMAPYEITRLGVARTFQNIRVFKEMSLLENVLVAMGGKRGYGSLGLLFGSPAYRAAERLERDTAHELLARVGLAYKAFRAAGTLSYGEQRRLEIARALATKPKLLLLDEPAAGMNSGEKQELMEEVRKLDGSGISVFIIEHDMRFIMALCQEIAVLNFGRMIARGAPEQIRAHPEVIEAYLGRDDLEVKPWACC
jgi:branched-chain amino acid transport system ATP-binding protein